MESFLRPLLQRLIQLALPVPKITERRKLSTSSSSGSESDQDEGGNARKKLKLSKEEEKEEEEEMEIDEEEVSSLSKPLPDFLYELVSEVPLSKKLADTVTK